MDTANQEIIATSAIEIGGKLIQNNVDKVFIIAEIGMNHNGVYENALKLIDQAADMGVDCVKFQMRNLKSLYVDAVGKGPEGDLSTQYTLDLLRKFELTNDQYAQLAQYTAKKGLIFMCTPWDRHSVDVLESMRVPAYKIASADLTNVDLLEYVAATGKAMIISTGMSTEAEIRDVVQFLALKEAKFAILHCNSTYPAPFKDINLRYMQNLLEYGVPIGYSGHERGTAVSIAAVAAGARIIERHFTLDRNMEGPDHAASLEFEDFKSLVMGIREVELALGVATPREMTQGEMINRENLGKSIYLKVPVAKGIPFQSDFFEIKSPGKGLSPLKIASIVGKMASRDFIAGECLYPSDFEGRVKAKPRYKFNLKWGMPVRFHDLDPLLAQTTPDFVEFHLSYKDLDADFSGLPVYPHLGFIMHVPELFENDHLLDLCTPNEEYRKLSVANLQRVINITRQLKAFFPTAKRPGVVIHCGGFTRDTPIPLSARPAYYENLKKSFLELDTDGIELLPENMAPFPWHFGGQRHQNIFIDADEIAQFSEQTSLKICQDISHSFLACTHFGWDHLEYTRKLAPYTAHYHISDGRGVDGEGLQVGEGKIDFDGISSIVTGLSSGASFIPEVWQGHKNGGEGFWISLERLESYL